MVEAADSHGSKYQTYMSNSQFTSNFITQDFVPDGNLEKPVWRGASWVKVDHDAFNPVTFPQSAMDIAALWTPHYVYFAYRCKYTTLNVFEGGDPSKDFWTLWDRDVVEVFLNLNPGTCGTTTSLRWLPTTSGSTWKSISTTILSAMPSGIPGISMRRGLMPQTTCGPARCEFPLPL